VPNIIPLLTLEAQLKRAFRSHLKKLGFTRRKDGWLQPPAENKDAIRTLHQYQRSEKLKREMDFLKKNKTRLLKLFANGDEVDPKRIKPILVQVECDTLESDLFRMATLLWSVPVSHGYGRRLRFLILDATNNRLIGLFALGDPVFNLNARDKWIKWDANDRRERLVNVMDCFVLGAVPPYNMLLSTKMVACMVRSQEVWNAFGKKYSKSKGIISGQRKHAELVLVTTTSALGRSSVYNRLRLKEIQYFQSIGFTSGWGHFHVPVTLYAKIREYLKTKQHPYADNHRFGDGPNWKLRTVRAALGMLGFDSNILCHGISREVFACEFATNSRDYLGGRNKESRFETLLSMDTIADLAISRWILPRSERMPDFKLWDKHQILEIILGRKQRAIESMKKQV
jgi:Druantia protein DruA